jgi:tellurite resistance protein
MTGASDDPTEPGAPIFSEEGAEAREQLRAALHESAVTMRREREAAGEIDVDDAVLRERIEQLGFAGDAGRIFDLLPLVHVAWADGAIQPGERATILNLLRIRGIPVGPAYTTMEALLEKPPSPAYVEESLDLLRKLIEREGVPLARTILGLCILVAEAAGGLLGLFDPVSKKEREMIETIARRLGPGAVEELHRRLG